MLSRAQGIVKLVDGEQIRCCHGSCRMAATRGRTHEGSRPHGPTTSSRLHQPGRPHTFDIRRPLVGLPLGGVKDDHSRHERGSRSGVGPASKTTLPINTSLS